MVVHRCTESEGYIETCQYTRNRRTIQKALKYVHNFNIKNHVNGSLQRMGQLLRILCTATYSGTHSLIPHTYTATYVHTYAPTHLHMYTPTQLHTYIPAQVYTFTAVVHEHRCTYVNVNACIPQCTLAHGSKTLT